MSLEITIIRLELPLNFGGVNCYLVKTTEVFFMVDTGGGNKRKELIDELNKAGCKPGNLRMILLTHGDFDHSGNAAYLREKFGARIAMHVADSGVVEHSDIFWNRKKGFFLARKIVPFVLGFKKSDRFVPDVLVEDESDLSNYGFPARVISIPGHSSGSIALLTDAGDLFCGDLIINPGVPETTTIIDDEGAAGESIRKLMDLNINIVYPGHGRSFTWREFLQLYKTKKG